MVDSKQKAKLQAEKQVQDGGPAKIRAGEKPVWEKPVAEDVSEQVMAQPYIRFT